MSKWRDAYLDALKYTRSAKTVETYGVGTKKFEAFLDAWQKTLLTAPRQTLSEFVIYMVKEGLSPSSVQTYAIAAIQFCRWCRENGLAVPEFKNPEMPGIREPVPVVLREKALAAYIQIAKTIKEPYATAMMLLPLTGLRVSELVALTIDDVEIDPPWVRFIVRDSKNKSGRKVPMLASGKPMLARYLKYVRPELSGDRWLFPSRDGTPIPKRMLQKHMRLIRGKLGMLDLTPHKLRHTYLTILNDSGITGFDLAEIAGHKNLNTSRLYVHPSASKLSKLVDSVETPWMKGT